MTTTELRRVAKKALDELSETRLRTAVDIISYLRDRASDESVADLGKINAMERRIKKARRDVATGRTRHWREFRQDV